jgi:hypothetical protein
MQTFLLLELRRICQCRVQLEFCVWSVVVRHVDREISDSRVEVGPTPTENETRRLLQRQVGHTV